MRRAVVDLLGESAAPSFERLLEAWRAVPDVRTLTQISRLAVGRSSTRSSPASGRPCPRYRHGHARCWTPSSLTVRLWVELAAGVDRLRLLVDALAVLDSELIACRLRRPVQPSQSPARVSTARSALLARLASAHPEAACDAEAVLTLGPVSCP